MASIFRDFVILVYICDRENNANLANLSQSLFLFTFKIILTLILALHLLSISNQALTVAILLTTYINKFTNT